MDLEDCWYGRDRQSKPRLSISKSKRPAKPLPTTGTDPPEPVAATRGADQQLDRRSANILMLYRQFVREQYAFASSASGLGHAFSCLIEVDRNFLRKVRAGSLSVGDELARQIECRTGKPEGWLDGEYQDDGSSWLNADAQVFAGEVLAALRMLDAIAASALVSAIGRYR